MIVLVQLMKTLVTQKDFPAYYKSDKLGEGSWGREKAKQNKGGENAVIRKAMLACFLDSHSTAELFMWLFWLLSQMTSGLAGACPSLLALQQRLRKKENYCIPLDASYTHIR